jgi:methyl-accepting chemotaxis protein
MAIEEKNGKELENRLFAAPPVSDQEVSEELTRLARAIKRGSIKERIDLSRFADSRAEPLAKMINEMLDDLSNGLLPAADYVRGLASGNIPPKIEDKLQGYYEEVRIAVNTVTHQVNMRGADIQSLVDTVKKGDLHFRADVDKYRGSYSGRQVAGINETLDALVSPLTVAANYVERISKGDIPTKIHDEYQGDFNRLKNNLNTCIDAIERVVAETDSLANATRAGNLTLRADASKQQGVFRKILEGVNHTIDVLHDTMAQVGSAAGQVTAAAEEIAASSQSVAQGASEQASALEETSSTLEQISSMTKQNADNTQRAKTLALNTREIGSAGKTVMNKMIESMHKIRSSAEGTAEIIRDINEIAFQTNLLALNAAVEAARAGETGRGFAVVAEEVRSLALRAKDAAKKTEELIKQSVRLAGEGESISNEVSKDLQEIVDSVSKVTDIVGEIASASLEQARGVEQVNKAVADMDKVVQQAAANSEQSSSAAQELSSQSQELAALVRTFRLKNR